MIEALTKFALEQGTFPSDRLKSSSQPKYHLIKCELTHGPRHVRHPEGCVEHYCFVGVMRRRGAGLHVQ